ncbi:MAG: sigma-70 family RNA polymerase sigma factor [Clostridia bacterium]|nr:sigma-70 family RNA polymerase sigma factor [Clostridia bacterium]
MDKRPKRRKNKDNPYELISNEKKYYIKFKDSSSQLRVVEVSKIIYETFDSFELDDLSFLNEYDRHIEHIDLDENSIYLKGGCQLPSTESVVEQKLQSEELYLAINKLSDIQKRRIKMYYFEDLNLRQIAEKEGCSIMSVKESIESGIKKLKNF